MMFGVEPVDTFQQQYSGWTAWIAWNVWREWNGWTAWAEGSRGENVHGVASVGPVTLTKTIKLYSRLDNFDYILQAWNQMEKSTLLQREPGWNRCIQHWVTLVEHEPSIFSMKQHDTTCSRLNHAILSNSAVRTPWCAEGVLLHLQLLIIADAQAAGRKLEDGVYYGTISAIFGQLSNSICHTSLHTTHRCHVGIQ